MAVFRFRLTPVLRLRERHRETQRLAFAAVEEERFRVVDEIQRLENRLTSYLQEMVPTDGSSLSVVDLQLYGDFVPQLQNTLEVKYALLRQVEERHEACRLALLVADTEVKSLEQLRSRLTERHLQEETAAAQQQVDEVGQRKYLVRQRTIEERLEEEKS